MIRVKHGEEKKGGGGVGGVSLEMRKAYRLVKTKKKKKRNERHTVLACGKRVGRSRSL